MQDLNNFFVIFLSWEFFQVVLEDPLRILEVKHRLERNAQYLGLCLLPCVCQGFMAGCFSPLFLFLLLSGRALPGDQRAGRALKTVSSTAHVPAHLVEDPSQKALINAEFIQMAFPSIAARGNTVSHNGPAVWDSASHISTPEQSCQSRGSKTALQPPGNLWALPGFKRFSSLAMSVISFLTP